jgi:DNA repair protein RecO (recombination protein O)
VPAGSPHDVILPANLLRWFDLQLLSLAGFQPQFFNCLSCGAAIEPGANFFSLGEGGVFCPRCGPLRSDVEAIAVDVLKVLRYVQRRPWQEVRRLSVRPGVARQVDVLLLRYLSHVLERRLRAPDFLRRLEYVRQPLPSQPSSLPAVEAEEQADAHS